MKRFYWRGKAKMLHMGKLIRQLRKQQKMTQKELAEGIVSEPVMSRIENGTSNPNLNELCALFQKLGKSLAPFEIVVCNCLCSDDPRRKESNILQSRKGYVYRNKSRLPLF